MMLLEPKISRLGFEGRGVTAIVTLKSDVHNFVGYIIMP